MSENIDFQFPMKKACGTAISQFCKDIPHGHARVIRCLQDNKDNSAMPQDCKNQIANYTTKTATDYRCSHCCITGSKFPDIDSRIAILLKCLCGPVQYELYDWDTKTSRFLCLIRMALLLKCFLYVNVNLGAAMPFTQALTYYTVPATLHLSCLFDTCRINAWGFFK